MRRRAFTSSSERWRLKRSGFIPPTTIAGAPRWLAGLALAGLALVPRSPLTVHASARTRAALRPTPPQGIPLKPRRLLAGKEVVEVAPHGT